MSVLFFHLMISVVIRVSAYIQLSSVSAAEQNSHYTSTRFASEYCSSPETSFSDSSMSSGTLRIRLTFSKSHNSPDNHKITSIWDRLPSERPHSTARRNATFNPHKKDYRLGPLRIDWVDLKSPMETNGNTPQTKTSQGKLSDRKGK
jgi:hypothetical protein